jgi:hypothetical protein
MHTHARAHTGTSARMHEALVIVMRKKSRFQVRGCVSVIAQLSHCHVHSLIGRLHVYDAGERRVLMPSADQHTGTSRATF